MWRIGSEQCSEPFRDRCERELRLVALAFRATKVACEDRTSAARKHCANGGEARSDTAVVGDDSAVHWDVEIHTNEDPLPVHRHRLDALLVHGGALYGPTATRCSMG